MSRFPLVFEAGSTRLRSVYIAAGVGALIFLVVLPQAIGDAGQVDTLSELVAYFVAITGLSILTGYCGQISIGHSAFVGLGGYATVILVADHGWPYLATIPVGIAVCLVAGALVAIPALRISGLYLATVTLAIAAVFPSVVDQFSSLSGGPNGKVATNEMSAPSWFPVDTTTTGGPSLFHFYVIAAIAVVMFVVAHQIVRSRIGRALVAIRESPYSAAASGIDVARFKIFAFAVSAAFAGVAGSLLTIESPQVTDSRFDLNLSIFLLIGLIAGGRSSIYGAIPGAFIFVCLSNYIPSWVDSLNLLNGRPDGGQLVGVISGGLLIAFAFLLPGGVIEGLERLCRPLVRINRRPPDDWRSYELGPSAARPETPRPTSFPPVSHSSVAPD